MIESDKFAELAKKSSQSFVEQRNMIKKVLAGKTVKCSQCHQTVHFNLSGDEEGAASIGCASGCTDICLDVA